MYISKIRLNNVRCFSDETIDLGRSHSSLLIAGNNGTGKSSVLRSIAMGICDEASAGGLLRELPGDFIRSGGKGNATIQITLSADNGEEWVIETKLSLYKKFNFERVEQKFQNNMRSKSWRLFPWEDLFVVAYGPGLRTGGTSDYDQYFSGDAVYSLFKYSQTLQNPELAWRRLRSVDKSETNMVDENISKMLGDVLDLDLSSRVILEPNGIFIASGNNRIELGAVGDGYRSMITLILDLLSWHFLVANKDSKSGVNWSYTSAKDMSGIVIIDEIEKHLHPLLQRKIVKHLCDKFPNIQFILSTHSPLCVSGVSDVEAVTWKIITSHTIEGQHKLIEKQVPFGLRADQVLVEYFDLSSSVSIGVEETINEYSELFHEKVKTPQMKARLKQLEKKLQNYDYNLAETVRDREVQRKLLSILQKEETEDND